MSKKEFRVSTNGKLYSFILKFITLYTIVTIIATHTSADYVVSISGLNVIRAGDSLSMVATTYNYNSTEEVLLSRIEVYDENNKVYLIQDFGNALSQNPNQTVKYLDGLTLEPIAPLTQQQQYILTTYSNPEVNKTMLSQQWTLLKDKLDRNIVEYGVPINITALDYNKDNKSEITVRVFLKVNETKMMI